MNDVEREEARLARLLGAAHAPADPMVLARARARLAAMPNVPRLFAWLGTPAALVAACAVLMLSAGLSFAMLERDDAASRESTFVSAMIDDPGDDARPAATTTAPTDGGGADSGEVAR